MRAEELLLRPPGCDTFSQRTRFWVPSPLRPAHLKASTKQRNRESLQIRLGREAKSWPGFCGKVCSLHSFTALLLFWCLLLPKSEISTFLFNVEINFHPVTLNLTRRQAAFSSPPPPPLCEGGKKRRHKQKTLDYSRPSLRSKSSACDSGPVERR